MFKVRQSEKYRKRLSFSQETALQERGGP